MAKRAKAWIGPYRAPAVALLAAAILAAVGGSAPALADCAEQCRAQHNQCRIATKGSPSCDAALTQCLRSCTSKR